MVGSHADRRCNLKGHDVDAGEWFHHPHHEQKPEPYMKNLGVLGKPFALSLHMDQTEMSIDASRKL